MWAFGVTLWELFSLGNVYNKKKQKNVLRALCTYSLKIDPPCIGFIFQAYFHVVLDMYSKFNANVLRTYIHGHAIF